MSERDSTNSPERSPLVLASRSPRRRDLLETVGLPFEIVEIDVDETLRPDESARVAATRLAADKARAGAELVPGHIVVAADTIVAVDERLLGKPGDAQEAARMLTLLSGRWHEVVTGVAIAAPNHPLAVDVSRTEIRFAELSREEIERYASGGEPLDKAGAYAIQGAGGWFVEEIRGSASNVVGLPLETLRRLLGRVGATPPSLQGGSR